MSIEEQIINHINDRDNPHNLTKEDLELGQLRNLPIASLEESLQASKRDLYLTPLRLKALFDGFLIRKGLMSRNGTPLV